MYSSQTDLEHAGIRPATLVQLADHDEDGVADAAVVAAVIAAADGIIDSYLAARYTVPLAAPIPATIVNASVSLAVQKLYQDAGLTNEARDKAAKAAMDYLKALANGTATLGVASPPAAVNEGGPASSRTSEDRIMTIGGGGETGTLDNY